MQKKILATAAALSLTFGALAAPVVEESALFADTAITADALSATNPYEAQEGTVKTYGKYKYVILGDKTGKITAYTGSEASIEIPKEIQNTKITAIGNGAFQNNKSVVTVDIPNTIKTIGDSAFSGCSKIAVVTTHGSFTSIKADAFSGTKLVKDNQGNKKITKIGNVLVDGSKCVGTVTVPYGVTVIAEAAFMCPYSDTTKSTSGSTVTNITYNTKITKIILPSTVKTIGDYAFFNCENLKAIKIPSSVTSIGYYAFSTVKFNTEKKAYNTYYTNIPATVYTPFNSTAYNYAKAFGIKSSVTSGKAYTYKVVKPTYFSKGYTIYKNVSTGKSVKGSYTAKLTLGTPTVKVAAGKKKAVISWNKVKNATGYKVFYKTSPNGSWKVLKTTSSTKISKTGLTSGKVYYFAVKAYKKSGSKVAFSAAGSNAIKVK